MEFGFFDALNSREDAVAVWTVVFLVFVAIKIQGIGSPFLDVLRALAQPRLLALFGLAALYCAGLVYGARELDLWHTSALKETLYWFFLTGVVLVGNATHAPPEKYLKTLLRQAVRFTLVVEFLVNLYVFPFLVELVFVPFVSLFVVTQVVVASKPEYAPALKFTEVVLALVGIALLSYALTSGLSDVDGFLTRENAENFLVAPALTLAFLPYCLAVAWVSRREQENLRKQFRAQYSSPGIGGPGAIRPGGGSRRVHKTIAPG